MTAAADRHLLFGLLALQNGIIDQVQLVAAFQAWTLDKSRALADHLEARGDLNPARRALLEALAAVHLEAHGGDVGESLAAVSAGRSTRESLARIGDPDIEATLGHVASARVSTDDGDGDRTASCAVGTATGDGHRFRVLRPHARGGLGVVFVALDAELNREVALKQILDHHADDPASRQRFLIEAEITGGLEHPGIVPVYGLGTYDGGRPYYAMRFIKGDSLKEAIEQFHADDSLKHDPGGRSLELLRLLRRFLDVCNAIDYAHSRGVLHRDIKPGNVIVGRHGETLVVDWGLAKPLGRIEPGREGGERTLMPSSASGSAETLPGSAMGTPAYMSPEQARGDLDRLGPRSDVYSLGATLYCLLTGRPPFESEDIGAMLRKVQRGDFPPPRQFDPGLDRALEAVCLKAMATEPEDRYPSGRALAEDVERWTADEAVTAYREPFTRWARRWAERNRTAVTAAAVALIAGVVGLSAVLAVQTRSNTALAAANAELTRSKAAVQDRYDLAVDAIKTFHTGVSEDFLLEQDQFGELRDRLLNSAADFYVKLSALLGKESDVASRRALARSNYELADLTGKVGRKEDALAAHRSVLARREALASEPGADPEATADVGRSLTAVACLLESTGKAVEAEAAFRKAEALLADLARSSPAAPAARAALAACRARLGYLLSTMGRSAAALEAYRLAKVDQEARAAAPGATIEARRDLADTINNLGLLLSETGRPAEAEAEYRAAMATQRKLADDNPGVTLFRSRLADGHNNLGNLLSETGRPTEAEAEYRAAVALQRKLADDNPAATQFRTGLAVNHNNLGIMLSERGRPSEAEAEYRQAVALHRKLADDNPAVTPFRSRLANCHNNLGWLLSKTGRPSEAEAEYRAAMAVYQKLADDNPAVTVFRNQLANCQTNLADLLRKAGRRDEARAACQRARALRQPLVRDHPRVTAYRGGLAETELRTGQVLLDAGDPVGASAAWRRAVALYDGLESPNNEQAFLRSACHASLAGLAGRPGPGVSAGEGQPESDRAMSWVRQAVALGYLNPDAFRTEAAFDSIRDRDDFRLLMMDLAMPDGPFAK